MDELWRPNQQDDVLNRQQRHKLLHVENREEESVPRPITPWHLHHRPNGNKHRKKLIMRNDIAQIGFGGCGGMYNYFLGVASVLQVRLSLSHGHTLMAWFRKSMILKMSFSRVFPLVAFQQQSLHWVWM